MNPCERKSGCVRRRPVRFQCRYRFLAAPTETCSGRNSIHFRFRQSPSGATSGASRSATIAAPSGADFLPHLPVLPAADRDAQIATSAARFRARNRAPICVVPRWDVRSAPGSPARSAAIRGWHPAKCDAHSMMRAHASDYRSAAVNPPNGARGGGDSDDGLRRCWRAAKSG